MLVFNCMLEISIDGENILLSLEITYTSYSQLNKDIIQLGIMCEKELIYFEVEFVKNAPLKKLTQWCKNINIHS